MRAIRENEKANEMLKKFTKLSDDDSRGDLFLKNVNYLDVIKNNSGRYTVENAGINSQYSDYGAAITLNKIVFASARDTGSLGQRKHTWTNQHFTDLYVADLDGEMNPRTVDKFDKTVKSKFHEATPTFTKDGKTMYFIRNNYLEGRENFPFINDENEFYFASDGHPGLGGLDIFISKIDKDGSFNKVQNVGSDVNSPKDDFAYWIDTKSRKGFFTSNRDGGQGYDDIYKFLELRKLTCEQLLFGKITDLVTNEMLPGAKISLFDSRFNAMAEVLADSKGITLLR